MRVAAFFNQHATEHLAARLGVSERAAAGLVSYAASVGGFAPKQAVKILQAAGSPSAKQIIGLLGLDEGMDEEETEATPEKVDPFDNKQHDWCPIITHSPQNDPATANYSTFSMQSGQAEPAKDPQ